MSAVLPSLISACAFPTASLLPPPNHPLIALLTLCSRPPPLPEPTPSRTNEVAKTSASPKNTHFCFRRRREKKRSWFGLPPEACLRCFRDEFAAACAFACCICFALT